MPLIFDNETPNSFEGDDYVFTMLDAETRETVRCVISREGIRKAIQKKDVYDPRIAFAMLKTSLGDLASARYDAGERPPRIAVEDVEAL
jgi:hypothetical protein